MICRGKGKNKEHCNRVIRKVLEHWDEIMYGKTTNETEVRENDLVKCGE